jgi:Protein of unknown function (DUF2934)
MTRNLQTTSRDEDIQRATEVRAESASIGRTPQSPERPGRPAPATSHPVSDPVVSGSSAQPQRSTRAPAGFDPPSSREALIASAAYYRAEKRGFKPGHEMQDWLAAEREIDGVGTDPV